MTDFDLIIFDCDGVVVDSESLSCGCLKTLLGEHRIEVELPEVYERFLGRSFQAVAEQYRVWRAEPIPANFRARFETAVREAFTTSLHAMPGIRDLLLSLQVPFCIASSSGIDRIGFSLKLAGLDDLFDGRVFSAEMVARGKPAPDLFLHAAKEMGARAERCLVIEDSLPGISAGVAAGMTVWGFAGGSHFTGDPARQRLRASGAARVFDKMADLQQKLAA